LGLDVPKKPEYPINQSIPADGDPKKFQPVYVKQAIEKSAALSMANTIKNTIKTRQVAILAANGVNEKALNQMQNALMAEGALTKIIAPTMGYIKGDGGTSIKVDQSFLMASSVLFDAVYVPGGAKAGAILTEMPEAIFFVEQAYKHCKAIAADNEGVELLKASSIGRKKNVDAVLLTDGVIINKSPKDFIKAIASHRFWEREMMHKVPA
jgi:catalase